MSDPTIAPECTCPWTERTDTWSQPESWTYYFEAQEYDPQCPEHGGFPLLEAPEPCVECGGSGMLTTKHFDEYSAEVHVCDWCAGSGDQR